MPGDYSRRTFVREKHYAGVQAQQGRVLADADVNEQLEIGLHRTQLEARDTIGPSGVPKDGEGFRVATTPDGADLFLAPGRAYVGGLLCELEAKGVPLSFPAEAGVDQAVADHLIADGRPLEAGQWVQILAQAEKVKTIVRLIDVDAEARMLRFSTDVSSFRALQAPVVRRMTTYITQRDLPAPALVGPSSSPPGFQALILEDGSYLAYLEAWTREVTALRDPHIREVALGGPDTGTRIQTVWQLKLQRVTSAGAPECATSFPEWDALVAAPTGLVTARAITKEDDTRPCRIPAQSRFRGLENQLYRVEIQKGGGRDAATFKWSRENASVETRITVSGDSILAEDLGRDEVLGFKGGNWVEIVDEAAALCGTPHPLFQIEPPDQDTREIKTAASIAAFAGQLDLTLRRWDQTGVGATADGIAMTADWIELEDGVEVAFSDGLYRPGDYWLVPARTSTGDVEWPPFEVPNLNPIAQPPLGIPRHYCRLALVTVAGGAITATDCRPRFPALTDIDASDVGYDPARCHPLAGATTVQEALDILCHRGSGTCTLVARHGDDVQALFDLIPAGGHAEVCFPMGLFKLDRTVVVKGKGRLKVSGAGPGTVLKAMMSEAALRFEECASVVVRDLAAEGSDSELPEDAKELNGPLTFQDCMEVSVEDVHLRCAGGPARSATCVTVRNSGAPGTGGPLRPSVHVANCRLEVGNLQTGVLVVNAARVDVRANALIVASKPAQQGVGKLVLDKRYLAALRGSLVAKAVLGTKPRAGGATNAKVTFGSHTVLFQTPPALKKEWQKIITARPPVERANGPQVMAHIKKTAAAMLVDPQLRALSPKLAEWFGALARTDEAIGFQGIVVAGHVAREVRIVDNSIHGFLQGVHVGVSHRVASQDVPASRTDHAGTVSITGNVVQIMVAADSVRRERHGIFVGNCESLVIEHNVVRLRHVQGSASVAIDGARIHGFLGKRVIVRHNHVVGFPTGLSLTPRYPYPKPNAVLWLVAENVFEGAQKAFRLPGPPHAGVPVTLHGNRASA
jgi:hypothetical protein